MESKALETFQKRHLRLGWWGLLIFLGLGIVLETLHGLKLPYYLDLRNASRRLMWTLAHSHGTLFALVNIAFAFTVPHFSHSKNLVWTSRLLIAGMIGMPVGFFAAGAWLHQGEPGFAVFLVPVFGFAMLVGVCLVLTGLQGESSRQEKKPKGRK